MRLKTLSASSVQTYVNCPARWKANYEDRAAEESSDAASLGSACHLALEWFVAEDHYRNSDHDGSWLKLSELFRAAANEYRLNGKQINVGTDMLANWLSRQDWDGREVLSTEKKVSFKLPTSIGDIPFNYIWDRCDRLTGNEIEVVDYKSWVRNVSGEDVKHSLQCRAYALAAQIQYPEAERIWVTLDQLRYSAVGVAFTREENRETWRYLRQVAEQIIASDGSEERVNGDCRWCVRRHTCKTLESHISAGGPLSITNPHEAAEYRHRLYAAKGALESMIGDLDRLLLEHSESEELVEWEAETGVVVKVGVQARRSIDAERIAAMLGTDTARFIRDYGGLTVSALDRALKDKFSWLTDDQKAELRGFVQPQHGEPKVYTYSS